MAAGALRRFAGAIEAAVFAAHLAASSQLGTETMTGAVQSDGQIIRRQTERGCDLLERHPIEVNLFEHVLILFRQAGQEPLHTLAEDSCPSAALTRRNYFASPPCLNRAASIRWRTPSLWRPRNGGFHWKPRGIFNPQLRAGGGYCRWTQGVDWQMTFASSKR